MACKFINFSISNNKKKIIIEKVDDKYFSLIFVALYIQVTEYYCLLYKI